MNLPFALRLARRESRHGIRRLGVYMGSITLGVAALVSIHSFRADVERSLREEAEILMGADARLSGRQPPPRSVEAVLDSLAGAGVEVSRVTTTTSMVLAPASDAVRLLQVRAVEGGYPFYGALRTSPEVDWSASLAGGSILVDPAVLTQLDVEVGDTLVVGTARFPIAATVENAPTELGMQAAVGPRIHLSSESMERAGVLGFGSLARYEVYLRIPVREDRRAVRDRYEDVFGEARLSYTLAEEQAQLLSNGIRYLGRFLALVGLAALLLGGVGVASAVHVYVREKRASVAVLRCLGADQWTAFVAYLVQAAGLGLAGAVAGVTLGVLVQQALPTLLAGAIPVPVHPRLSPASAAAGLGIGVWVAGIFALVPLLSVRDVPPLQALRADVEPRRTRGRVGVFAAYLALGASVALLCVIEAPEADMGLAFAGALFASVGALAAVGWVTVRATRRLLPARASYPVRQGVSNLFRPRNQTVALTLALGFGAFIVGTVVEVEQNLRRDLELSFGEGRPNVLLFDVQPDQLQGVLSLLPPEQRAGAEVSPLVTSRIASINGRTPDELRADTVRSRRPEGWALRHEYRNTYRAALGRAETLVAGRWWDGTPGVEDDARIEPGGLTRVSLEEDVAESLRVGLGDTVTWNVSGIEIPSVVTSLRRVDWERLEPNFFAVLEPRSLEAAPQTLIVVARLPADEARARLQRDLVGAFPNVSALDFARVQEAIDSVLSGARRAVGFLGAFCGLAGLVVLVGALATSRVQRLRESALLRTLGARRSQIRRIFFVEYLALGTLATAAGLVLAEVGATFAVPWLLEVRFVPSPGVIAVLWLIVAGATTSVGVLGSRGVVRRHPLPVLRALGE